MKGNDIIMRNLLGNQLLKESTYQVHTWWEEGTGKSLEQIPGRIGWNRNASVIRSFRTIHCRKLILGGRVAQGLWSKHRVEPGGIEIRPWLQTFERLIIASSYLVRRRGWARYFRKRWVGPKGRPTEMRPWLTTFKRSIGESSYLVGGWVGPCHSTKCRGEPKGTRMRVRHIIFERCHLRSLYLVG